MKLFLDIDGVLLGRRQPGAEDVCLANHALSFLAFCNEHFECCWLTTRIISICSTQVELLSILAQQPSKSGQLAGQKFDDARESR